MLLINIIFLILFLILWLKAKSYHKGSIEQLDKKQHPLKQLYPIGLYIYDKTFLGQLLNKFTLVDDSLKALHVGDQIDSIKRFYICKKVVLLLMVLFFTNFFSLLYQTSAESNLLPDNYIKRPEFNQGSESITLDVLVTEDQKTILEEEITIDVSEEEYDDSELEEKLAYSKRYIEKTVLGNNKSADYINTNLNFPTSIPRTGIKVSWETKNNKLIDSDGLVHNEELLGNELVEVTATLSYKGRKEMYTMYFNVFPKEYSKEDITRNRLLEVLKEENSRSKTENLYKLPDSIENQKISWAEKKDNTPLLLIALGLISGIAVFVLMDRNLTTLVEKRNQELLLDYPEIINKFTLLIGAGMSLSNAWIKIAKDYKENATKKRYAYEEINITAAELMIGTSEVTAYEHFGKRVKLLPYLRFSSLIAQNVKKGSAELLNQLELEAAEAFEERKEIAKRMGEEAGTKLLLPMVLMLLIVLAIIMIPAFLSFGI